MSSCYNAVVVQRITYTHLLLPKLFTATMYDTATMMCTYNCKALNQSIEHVNRQNAMLLVETEGQKLLLPNSIENAVHQAFSPKKFSTSD